MSLQLTFPRDMKGNEWSLSKEAPHERKRGNRWYHSCRNESSGKKRSDAEPIGTPDVRDLWLYWSG